MFAKVNDLLPIRQGGGPTDKAYLQRALGPPASSRLRRCDVMLIELGELMKPQEATFPVTDLETRAAELLREVSTTQRPAVITEDGEARGVLLDIASYRRLRDAPLLSQLLARAEADIEAGHTVAQDDVFAQARRRIERE